MKSNLAYQTELSARRAVPIAVTALLSLVGMVTIPIPEYGLIAPSLPLIAIFCWTVWRPDLLPFTAVFTIGLFEDLMRGTPIGSTALVLLVAQGFVRSQQTTLYGKTFGTLWAGFAITGLLATTTMWLVMSLTMLQMLDPMPALFQLLLTLALFPLVAQFLLRLQRSVLRFA